MELITGMWAFNLQLSGAPSNLMHVLKLCDGGAILDLTVVQGCMVMRSAPSTRFSPSEVCSHAI